MPNTKHLNHREQAEWAGQDENDWSYPSDEETTSRTQAWAVYGFINWWHHGQRLLCVPFVYHPTPFLPGATTISLHSTPTDPATSRGHRTANLPTLPLGDEWVMVDHYWRHELLGWMEARDIAGRDGGCDSQEPVGVSATTIEFGNLMADSEDDDNMDLLRYVFGHFRPAGSIRDIWVPVGQKGADRLKVVVVFAEDDAVGRALAMSSKEYFINDVSQIISVNRYHPVWYPAPRSQVPALEIYAVNTRTTSINALMWLDRDLANNHTDYDLPSVRPPHCRPFSEMPHSVKDGIRTYFGFETLEPIRLSGVPMGPKRHVPHPSFPTQNSVSTPPIIPTATLLDQVVRPPSPSSSKPASPLSIAPRDSRLDHRGLPIRALPSRHSLALTPSITQSATRESETSVEIAGSHPPSKRVKFVKGGSSGGDDIDSSDASTYDKTRKGHMEEIVQAQIGLAQISAKLAGGDGDRGGRDFLKRKAGELDDDERSASEDGSDMDMEIDD